MNNLNSVLLEGNLVRDPLIRSTPKGTQVCNFTIASNRFYRRGDGFEKETGYLDVETWGKLAEACGSRGQKGISVRVVGRLKQDRWTNAAGENRSRVVIVAEHVEFRSQTKKEPELDLETQYEAEAVQEETVLEQQSA